MPSELILVEDVADLGKIGDHVRVTDGYARNYLLPRKLAVAVTAVNLRRLEARKLRLQQEHEERVNVARALAEKIGKLSVTIPVQAGENDKLYGSVTSIQVVKALSEEGIQVEAHTINVQEPIRELGVYSIDVHLHAAVQAVLKVWVVRQ